VNARAAAAALLAAGAFAASPAFALDIDEGSSFGPVSSAPSAAPVAEEPAQTVVAVDADSSRVTVKDGATGSNKDVIVDPAVAGTLRVGALVRVQPETDEIQVIRP
jgi:hypothetical protein